MHSAAGGSGGPGLVHFVSAVPTVGWIQGNGMVVVHNRSAVVHLNLSLVAGCRVEWGEGYKGVCHSEYVHTYKMAQQCPTEGCMVDCIVRIHLHTCVRINE